MDKKKIAFAAVVVMIGWTLIWSGLTAWAYLTPSESSSDGSSPGMTGIIAYKISEPQEWYTPEELGIELFKNPVRKDFLHVFTVDEKAKSWLRKEKLPNVKYQDEFYGLKRLKDPLDYGILKHFMAERTENVSSETPTRTPEELGIIMVPNEPGKDEVFHIYIEDEQKAIPWMKRGGCPDISYNGKFYRVGFLWVAPPLPEGLKENIKRWQNTAWTGIIIGLIVTGTLYFKERKKRAERITAMGCILLISLMSSTIASGVPKIPTKSSNSCLKKPLNTSQTQTATNVSEAKKYLWAAPPLPENLSASCSFQEESTIAMAAYLEEVNETEGSHPLYALVIGDYEEMDRDPDGWKDYAILQIERGDEPLVREFGIDIRILDVLGNWNSPNYHDWFYQLWLDLEQEYKGYLGRWYEGEYWSDYVDLVIGITAQWTVENMHGLTPGANWTDQGRIFCLLRWTGVYCFEDNLVTHEISHLYYADNHPASWPHCCFLARHEHYQTIIIEDGVICNIWNWIPCAFTAGDWCHWCKHIISTYPDLYDNYEYMLVLRNWCGNGSFNPIPGVYHSSEPFEITVTAKPGSCSKEFAYWLIDGRFIIEGRNPLTISVNGKKAVAGIFRDRNYTPPKNGGSPFHHRIRFEGK